MNKLVKKINTQQNDQGLKCPGGKLTGKRYDQFMIWPSIEMTGWWNGWKMKWSEYTGQKKNAQWNDQALKCPSGETTGQGNDQLMKWLVDEMAVKWKEVNILVKEMNAQWNDQALKCPGDERTGQRIDHLMKWPSIEMTGWWNGCKMKWTSCE